VPPKRFTARLHRLGINLCLEVPAAVSKALGKRGYVYVVARANRGAPFPATFVPRGGGRHRLFLNGEVRTREGIAQGDNVDITFRVEEEPRVWAIPEDLSRALREEGVLAAFESFPRGRRNEIVRWLEGAATDATRAKRIARAVEVALGAEETRSDKRSR